MDSLEKFQDLLKNIFQFEFSDLDFGIYKIFNYKKKEIDNFIQNNLPDIVKKAFEKHKSNILDNINKEFENVKQEIIKNFGVLAFDPVGELKKEFKDTPLGEKI